MKIKPCPFCGSKSQLDEDILLPLHGDSFPLFFVVCTNEKCKANNSKAGVDSDRKRPDWLDDMHSHDFLSKEEAIEAWNRRV